jgi:hypothetical protein
MDENSISIQNEKCTLVVNKTGGSITRFQLEKEGVNPFTFSMKHESPFHKDIEFKGHFLCLGRWGDPSQGELRSGLNKHGEFVKLKWDAIVKDHVINMNAFSRQEGLSVARKFELSKHSACYKITEKIRNENALGRMYQMVQHPTIAAPFLNAGTHVDCNASLGFDYASEKYKPSQSTLWPQVITKNKQEIKLDQPGTPYSSVFPFIVNPEDDYGWITAWSPVHQTLAGYIWKRKDYPWINHWLHWESEGYDQPTLIYRGLEFGNTGIHKPFNEILSNDLLHVLGQPSMDFIDSGEEHSRSFYSFIHALPPGFNGAEKVILNAKNISILEKKTGKVIIIDHTLN